MILLNDAKVWGSVVGWMFLNISLFLITKALFINGFRFPLLILSFGVTCTMIGCAICVYFWFSVPLNIVKENWKILLVMAICQGLSQAFEGISIVHISISLNQVIKALTPAGTLFAIKFYEGAEFSNELTICTAVIVFGVVMAILNNPSFEWIGFITAFLSMVFGVVYHVSSGEILKKTKINSIVATLIITFPMLLSVFPVFLATETEELKVFVAQPHVKPWIFVLITIVLGCMSFMYNAASFYVIEYTSAHYAALIGNMKVILLVIISELVFKTKLEVMNYIGMVISLVGFCAYNYYKHHENLRRKEMDNIYELTQLENETDDEDEREDHRK